MNINSVLSTPDVVIGLDFETYASTDLLKHGLDQYVNCPDFQVLLGVTATQLSTLALDFVNNSNATEELRKMLEHKWIVAHNAGFERAVLKRIGIDLPADRFFDSAAMARAAGAAGKLEAAAPQLLGVDKLESGLELIKLFSIPGEYQVFSSAFDPQVITDHPDQWKLFESYCRLDAELSLRLFHATRQQIPEHEFYYNAVTMEMNSTGWPVDLDLVRNMQARYLENVEQAVHKFKRDNDADELNLNSFPQLKAWCKKRGVNARSFNEQSVQKMLDILQRKLDAMSADDAKRDGYMQVVDLLHTKQIMGGSSLKKLQTILDTVGSDGRLHDQYLHCGAGATYRTSGRGVQMQNLKRLTNEDDVELLFDADTQWDNQQLASNLRQVFTSSHPEGALLVGDFSSVESRGLAWQAGEQWKLDAYAQHEDLYKVQAAHIFGIEPHDVNSSQRQIGKVAELSCGYGAGAEAVMVFAEKMGVNLDLGEAGKLVKDWRAVNLHTGEYWQELDEALHRTTGGAYPTVLLPFGKVQFIPKAAPLSLMKQTGNDDLVSIQISVHLHNNQRLFTRVIHGVHPAGSGLHFWKPSERKTGDLWKKTFTDPKTKRLKPYTIYGAKLSGILTQSLCREIFFQTLEKVYNWTTEHANLQLIGQFHDEIVLDWQPMAGGISQKEAEAQLLRRMSSTPLVGFPLEAVVKSGYRYIK